MTGLIIISLKAQNKEACVSLASKIQKGIDDMVGSVCIDSTKMKIVIVLNIRIQAETLGNEVLKRFDTDIESLELFDLNELD